MDKLIFTAVSGAERTLRAQQVRANNLANIETAGFRANLEVAATQAMQQGYGYDSMHLSKVDADTISTRAGAVRETGRPLDVAINGNGYLAVQYGEGEAYTRAGAIDIDAEGNLSVNGHPLMGEGGPIVLPPHQAVEIGTPPERLLEVVRSTEYSRLPVYRGRMDNVEGLIHTKDLLPYLIDHKEFNIASLLRRPLFVPESASIEKVMLQLQESAVHLAFVVDEFGTLEGIVTLEDIIEEIVGDIRDEYDEKAEDWFQPLGEHAYLVKGNASLKELCQRLPLCLPQKEGFSTLAGFLLYEFGRIPHEKDELEFQGHTFIVERLTRRHISLVRVLLKPPAARDADENRRLE